MPSPTKKKNGQPLPLFAKRTAMPLKFAHIYLPAMAVIWLGLSIDSVAVTQYLSYGQGITNILVALVFLWIFSHVSKVSKQLMFFGVVISYAAELTLSLGLGMYTYRLENVPHYVPLGHAIVYAAVYYITKEPWVRKHQKRIIAFLYPSIIVYSFAWFFIASDLFGLLCMLTALYLFKRMPETRLFFLFMFFMVVYLELLGTYYGCWVWPPVWFDVFTWMPSANPPSGIGAVYFGLDAACLLAYKMLHLQAWRRFRLIQSLQN